MPLRKSLSLALAAVLTTSAVFAQPQPPNPGGPPAPQPSNPPVAPLPAARPNPGGPGGDRQLDMRRAQAEMQRAQAEAQRVQVSDWVLYLQGRREKASFLGVSASPVTPVLREQLKLPAGVGMVIDFVEPKSPADEAGLKQYDVLHKLDDQLLVNAHQLAVLVRMRKPGEEVTLTVIHAGEAKPVKVKLVEHEVMALDDKSPWGAPPMPFDAPVGADILKFRNFDQDFQLKLPPGASIGGGGGGNFRAQVNATGSATMSDDTGTITVTQTPAGRHLVAIDKSGKQLFNGPINTPEEVQKLPEHVRNKLIKLDSMHRNGPPANPATRPVQNPSFVPGFGRPAVIRLETSEGDALGVVIEGSENQTIPDPNAPRPDVR